MGNVIDSNHLPFDVCNNAMQMENPDQSNIPENGLVLARRNSALRIMVKMFFVGFVFVFKGLFVS